ncbi:MAG: lipoprotein releasing system transmembrane-like protein [Nitrospinae bacterium CG11_big_fil_rev_8_21_14_0_20_45_15]|nr:MAG: lipoprotein releasing system transmembrane-like protein [Nitrospinae bacterium CG11_big_fil_rev_8_21_14_0_20_45_15]
MIAKLAWIQFLRQGARAWLNVAVTGLTLVTLIFMTSLLNGFQLQASKNLKSTDVGGGHYRLPDFDILSPTEWEDQTFSPPPFLKNLSDTEKAEVLVLQGQLFPNRRLYPVQLRGIDLKQKLLDLPLEPLSRQENGNEYIPVIIGTRMSERSRLQKGDSAVLRWRDRLGVIDARDAKVIEVADFLNPRVDEGVVWLSLDRLRIMTRREGEVSWVTVTHNLGSDKHLEFLEPATLMSDILNLLKQDRRNAKVLWAILLFLAGTSVYNSQILNVFKRQKEIGAMMAFGMESRTIIGLYTLEGTISGFGAIFFAFIFGVPFYYWFQSVGLDISHLSASTMPVRERIFLDFHFSEMLWITLIMLSVVIFSAWRPVQKIARLEPTVALRGKGL